MTEKRQPPASWREEWNALGHWSAPRPEILHEMRRGDRRQILLVALEISVTLGLLALAGAAAAFSPQITDAVWIAGLVSFLGLGLVAALLARLEAGTSVVADTASYIAAYEQTCRRRVRRLGFAALVILGECAAFAVFAMWRLRAEPTSLTSHHGMASFAGTLLMLGAAFTWVLTRRRGAQRDLQRAARLRVEIHTS